MSATGRSPAPGIGVVGCGFVTMRWHLRAIPSAGGRVVALCDPDPGAVERASAVAPDAARHVELSGVLADQAVEAVASLEDRRAAVAAPLAAIASADFGRPVPVADARPAIVGPGAAG